MFGAKLAAVLTLGQTNVDAIDKNVTVINKNVAAVDKLLAAQEKHEHARQDYMKALGDMLRDVLAHAERLTDLASDVHHHKSQLKGYQEANDKTTAALCLDLNDTRAKFPDFWHEVQGEIEKSSTGLATAVKELETKVELELSNLRH